MTSSVNRPKAFPPHAIGSGGVVAGLDLLKFFFFAWIYDRDPQSNPDLCPDPAQAQVGDLFLPKNFFNP